MDRKVFKLLDLEFENPLGSPVASLPRSDSTGPLSIEKLVALKAAGAHRVAVVLPTLNEEATIGRILDTWLPLKNDWQLIDDLFVVDSGSSDRTRSEVNKRGVRWVSAEARMSFLGLSGVAGKGVNLAVALHESEADILIFADSDMQNPRPETISSLLFPILKDPEVMLVKAIFSRDTSVSEGELKAGGRVTRLTARPLIQVLFPELEQVVQPLNGNISVRRGVVEELELGAQYQVDIQLLIAIACKYGLGAIAQVDCGSFKQEGQSLDALERMARQVTTALFELASKAGRISIHTNEAF